jgi:outer membrane receptor for ferrienterochelin and colicin
VIPNPSAKYEAEGMGGIVNIVMKQGVSLGLSGSLSANSGTQGQNGGSARLNYQEGRVTFFGGGSLGFNHQESSSSDSGKI